MNLIRRILLSAGFLLACSVPAKEKAGVPIPVTGLAQVGVGGLSKAQVWIHPEGKKWPKDDPYFTKAPWQDAKILPPPTI